MTNTDMNEVFISLRKILKAYEAQLKVTSDTSVQYDVHTIKEWSGKPKYFGGVAQRKNYVSYYLKPVHAFPDLLNDISPDLKSHMHGTTCFNFKTSDEKLFKELAQLTRQGVNTFKQHEWM